MRRAIYAIALAALAGCEVRLSSGTTIRPGERVPVKVMCPGVEPFAGWIDHAGGHLTDGSSRPIGNSRQCAYIETGEPQKKD